MIQVHINSQANVSALRKSILWCQCQYHEAFWWAKRDKRHEHEIQRHGICWQSHEVEVTSVPWSSKVNKPTFTDTEVNNCFSKYHTSWITSRPKSNFLCDNILTKAILFFFGCSEVNSSWLITSELANQLRMRKVLFTCVVYTHMTNLTTIHRSGGG